MKVLSVLIVGTLLAVSSSKARPDTPPPATPVTNFESPARQLEVATLTTTAPQPKKSYAWALVRPGKRQDRLFTEGIVAGIDSDGRYSCVGRVFSGKEVIPGKVRFDADGSFGVWFPDKNDKEDHMLTFEMLLADDIVWVYGKDGSIPEGALKTGQTESGAPLYTCRKLQKNLVMVSGKLDVAKKACIITYYLEGLVFPEYEVLVVY